MTDEPMVESVIVDLTGVTLDDLRDLPDSVVAPALRRILEEIDSPQDAVAGFQSAI